MLHLITGGSGSGKSEYAEACIQKWEEEFQNSNLYYIATMIPRGKETKEKILRHQKMRSSKGFQTVECYWKLEEAMEKEGWRDSILLLECMSNLVANELYEDGGRKEQTVSYVCDAISRILAQGNHMVIVTNEVFSEAEALSEEMQMYKRILGQINCNLAEMADQVTEVVYGIPVEVKRCR